jgi:hypothetical protein
MMVPLSDLVIETANLAFLGKKLPVSLPYRWMNLSPEE